MELSLGFSPCPNDTYIFYALVNGLVDTMGLRFNREVLEDVETLNAWAMEARLDVTKLSFHALGHVADKYVLLSSGAALGRGCGPLLVSGRNSNKSDLAELKVAVPGRFTTAAMLLRMFAPECNRTVVMRFDEIMPAILAGKVDAGVIIHESRFTYMQHGLKLVQDLGEWWEDVSGLPIPLGGIAAKRSLGEDVIARVDECIRESVCYAFKHGEQALPYIRKHAQELDDTVIADHIALYVNPFSEKLGQEGMASVREFLRRGREAGIVPSAPEFQTGTL